jgi:hypothetical protein
MKAGIDQNPNNTSSSTNNIKTATVLESVNTKETKGFWKNFFGLPSRGIKAITRVFYDVD